MFLTCDHEIFDPLSLNVMLHHWKIYFYFGSSNVITRVWPKLFIKTKYENYCKFVNMNVMALQDLVLTFENCSKTCGCFNPLYIKQINKSIIWSLPKNWFFFNEKICSLCVLKQRKPKCLFPSFFSLSPLIWNMTINFARLGQSFDMKIEMKSFF